MKLVLIIFWIIFGLCMVYSLTKNENTSRQQDRILNAIHDYNMDMIYKSKFDSVIDYNCIEPYDKTFFRLWDWGYKRIVPPYVLEKIKPYIKSAN